MFLFFQTEALAVITLDRGGGGGGVDVRRRKEMDSKNTPNHP